MNPCLALAALVLTSAELTAADSVPLGSLDLTRMRQGWGQPQVDKAVTGKPLSIGGQAFAHGVGTHAKSTLWVHLGGAVDRFQANVGVDDGTTSDRASLAFQVAGDGRKLWESGVMRRGQPAKPLDVDVRGITNLVLLVTDGGDGVEYDHADWADARFVATGAKPRSVPAPVEETVILTPKPGPAPRLNAPRVTAGRPGNPFLFRIPTQGERPMEFTAEPLPDGLTLDRQIGIIRGITPPRGEYVLKVTAKNRHGTAQGALKVVSGDTLALTPTMGWNHWYTHYDRITDALMREAADVMVSRGMADVGYQYVSIDDCWMFAEKHADPLRVGPLRDAEGRVLPNKHFPDMPAMTEHIHAVGLKAGIYIGPGPRTCAGFVASWQHEAQDAQQFADWGFDLLKYDWCSYGEIAAKETDPELVKLKRPYILMGNLLKQQNRDLVFNLCQYGMGKVWEWGAEVGGHSWRTAGDLGFELDRVFEVALQNASYRAWQKPGAWNDPDYVQIGFIGNARGMGEPMPCPLTPSEQYAFMSLWCLMASPLFYSGDMGRLDDFTVNVLCNPEMIEVNQDPLGQCGRVVKLAEPGFAMVKEMEDGSRVVGLFNQGEFPITVTATWSELGLEGNYRARDLWRHQDLGLSKDRLTTPLPRRGAFVVRLWKAP